MDLEGEEEERRRNELDEAKKVENSEILLLDN